MSLCLSILAILASSSAAQAPSEIWGKHAGIKLAWHNGEIVETLLVRDKNDKAHEVLKTPSAPDLPLKKGSEVPTALRSSDVSALFSDAPSFRFTRFEQKGNVVTLIHESKAVTIKKKVTIPPTGGNVRVELTADFAAKRPSLEFLLISYAFTPDGKTLSKGGRPDWTYSPGLRPQDNQVVGDHFFRCPAITAQKGKIAAIMLPDVEHLAENRPMPTIIDLDCKNGVVDAPLMSYGFCDHKVVAHVYFAHDASMIRKVPNHLELAMDVVLSADAEPSSAHQIAAAETWKVGSKYFDKILPQAMPFEDYAKVCYPAAFNERIGDNKLGYFEVEIDGKTCGGVCAGWGYTNGWVSWQPWFNNLRSAWGMRWWGKKINMPDWVDKADKMLNLALAAPMDQGAVPTTYDSKKKEWKGCLIMPRADCYYDLTNMAWKGIWLLEWAKWGDCPRPGEVWAHIGMMAKYMMEHQNTDGSFPTWLTKDHKVVPILDHSAQTALPAWFLAEYALAEAKPQTGFLLNRVGPDFFKMARESSRRAADFLTKHVVDQNLWYDFETFFSCSPKKCFQVDGKIDDEIMWDPHTLCPPQNTLSMHWAAEALRSVGKVTGDEKYMPYALKALDMMNLYQNTWPISFRTTAYTYGGFGVQNSDGEYNDARQAQFGSTLCDFGAELGRKDLFERGVAATRASQTLINHPLHAEFGIYPNPNYPLGLQPENCCHGGGDHQAGRTGFDWGEGSGLTSMAWLLDKYGENYRGKGWSVLVDGGSKGIEMLKASRPPIPVDPAFNFDDWRMKGWSIAGDFAEVPTYSTRYNFNNEGKPFIGTCEDGRGGFNDEYTGTITSPKFKVSKDKMTLLVGGGSGPGVYVELIDATTGERLFIERGKNSEPMDRRTWDMSNLKDRVLQIRAVDNEKGGWGHINLGDIRFP